MLLATDETKEFSKYEKLFLSSDVSRSLLKSVTDSLIEKSRPRRFVRDILSRYLLVLHRTNHLLKAEHIGPIPLDSSVEFAHELLKPLNDSNSYIKLADRRSVVKDLFGLRDKLHQIHRSHDREDEGGSADEQMEKLREILVLNEAMLYNGDYRLRMDVVKDLQDLGIYLVALASDEEKIRLYGTLCESDFSAMFENLSIKDLKPFVEYHETGDPGEVVEEKVIMTGSSSNILQSTVLNMSDMFGSIASG